MKTAPLAVAALALALLPVLANAQSMQLKLGAWEMTYKSASTPKPLVDQMCLKQSDLAQLASLPENDEDEDEDCKLVKPPTVTGTSWAGDKLCPEGRKVHAELVAESPERVKGLLTSSAPRGGTAVKMALSGRWLKASCTGLH
jgi:hypothetical protein